MSPPTGATRPAVASVGVIGAGIFGASAAWELAESGFAVTLYEKREDIVSGTTARNFFRVHRGYHYPRDWRTAGAARDGYASFAQAFSAALTAPVPHHYAIAATGSQTTVEQFEQHCCQLGLRARRTRLLDLVRGSVEACFEVDEAYYDATRLRKLAWERLRSARVRVELKSAHAARDIGRMHDFVVVAAYGSLNEVLADLGCPPIELQYELCEVPVVHTPGLHRLSLVVLDGPFVSVAPYGPFAHILYDVVHSVHARFVGHERPRPSLGDHGRPSGTSACTDEVRPDPVLGTTVPRTACRRGPRRIALRRTRSDPRTRRDGCAADSGPMGFAHRDFHPVRQGEHIRRCGSPRRTVDSYAVGSPARRAGILEHAADG